MTLSELLPQHWVKDRLIRSMSIPSLQTFFLQNKQADHRNENNKARKQFTKKQHKSAHITNKSQENERSVNHSVVSNSLQPHGLQPTRFLCPWHFPGKNIGVGSHSLLQGIFSTQGSKTCLLHYRQVLYCLSQQGTQS